MFVFGGVSLENVNNILHSGLKIDGSEKPPGVSILNVIRDNFENRWEIVKLLLGGFK